MTTHHINKLALGTAQFGQDYGIAGHGQAPAEEVMAILQRAHDAGIDTLDTAAAYGDSEAVIGQQPLRHEFRLITKIPRLDNGDAEGTVVQAVEHSLERLGVERLHGLLAHQGTDLLGLAGKRIWRALSALRKQGLVERIGASVYRPEEAETLHARYRLDLVQIPYSLLDQRLVQSGTLDRLHADGVAIHARSVFLQGLLLMPRDQRPAWAMQWNERLDAVREWSDHSGLSPAAACLRFTLDTPGIERVIVGVNSATQLDELLACTNTAGPLPDADGLACTDEALIHPSEWPA